MALGAVVYAKDLDRMVNFYTGLGLALEDRAGDQAVLVGAGTEVTIVQAPAELVGSVQITDPPVRRSSTPIKLVFTVTSLPECLAAVTEGGGRTTGGPGMWTFRGHLHKDVIDPEGNVVQLRAPVP